MAGSGRDVGGNGGGSSGGAGNGTTSVVSATLSWRTPPMGSRKGDADDLNGGNSGGRYAAAHGSTGGALGWGAVMRQGGGAGDGQG